MLPPANPAPATNLILVRHGQSEFNRDGVHAGHDSPLTDLGWREAELAAEWLAHACPATAVVCSPLLRAQQTALVISERLGLPLVVQPGIEENHESYVPELGPASNDPLYAWDHPWQPAPASAPIYKAFQARLRAALQEILARHAGQTVIVVCHGGVIGTILRTIFGGHHVLVETANGGITHVTFREGRWRLIAHNVTEHLRPLADC